MIWVVTHCKIASQNSGVKYMSTSNMTSLAMDRRAGMLLNVTAVRDVTREWLGERTLSYHSIGMNSTRFGGGGKGCFCFSHFLHSSLQAVTFFLFTVILSCSNSSLILNVLTSSLLHIASPIPCTTKIQCVKSPKAFSSSSPSIVYCPYPRWSVYCTSPIPKKLVLSGRFRMQSNPPFLTTHTLLVGSVSNIISSFKISSNPSPNEDDARTAFW
mmetsp:Transcript_1217/g.2164  ORF Transcript_1217/g.2164 Transcript_1217/m.2164 type:complete len:214 (-) Transcript_1217:150-791(-)